MRRLLPLLLLLTATALAAPAGALADAGLSAANGQLTLTSDSGVAAKLVISKRTGAFDCGNTFSGGCIQLTDPKPIRLGNSGCLTTAGGAVACNPNVFASIKLVLGDGDDHAFVADGVIPTIMDGGTDDDNLVSNGGADTLLGGAGNDSLNDIGDTAGGDDAIDGGAGKDQILVGFGDDAVAGGSDADSAVVSVGNDTVRLDDVANDGRPGETKNLHSDLEIVDGGFGNDTLLGNAGPNELRGSAGSDVVDGGAGDDVLVGGSGSDDLIGGTGRDRVTYPEAVGAQRISLDGIRDDGASGELDNARADIEDVAAGPGDDVVSGNGAANLLDGGAGNDRLDGGDGVDTVAGGADADTVLARDGVREPVDCGAGADGGEADTIDELAGCEGVAISDERIPDADGDGASKPADCDDGNPAVRPGVVDTPDNGVDEDCSGADAVNLDRDADRFLRPTDCDDANPRINPGARDVPGNRIDEDCSGGPAPFPALGSIATGAFDFPGRSTRMLFLNIRQPRKGSTLKITCRGGGCPFRARTRRIARSRDKLIIQRPLGRAKLAKGTRVEVRLTKPRAIGFVVRFKMVPGGPFPKKQELCLVPGAGRPVRCT